MWRLLALQRPRGRDPRMAAFGTQVEGELSMIGRGESALTLLHSQPDEPFLHRADYGFPLVQRSLWRRGPLYGRGMQGLLCGFAGCSLPFEVFLCFHRCSIGFLL
jgi:hypothetical protein